MTVDPGAVNSIPRRVRMDIDVRDTDRDRRDAVLGRIRQAARDAAAARASATRTRSSTTTTR